MTNNLPEALELYRAAWMVLTKSEITVEGIDRQECGLGLIGPGNSYLTGLLETLLGWSSTFRLHALYHDVFGRIYVKSKKGPGYTYMLKDCRFKSSPLFGHLTGLLCCILFRKNIGRIIVNRLN